MSAEVDFPVGPVADKLTLWPVDDGRYGLDAVFQGTTGYERCSQHEEAMKAAGVHYRVIQGLDDSWLLRFGPLTALEIGRAVSAFVR